MFKAIKEFFVGKPKVEEAPAQCPYKAEAAPAPVAEATPTPEPAPVVEEIKITTVTLNDQITDAITITAKSDTVPTGAWPFPNGTPPEPEVKKKRTFVKREETATDKKPTSAIKANSKPRKKK
jgi:hypothetical protein